MEDAHHFEIEAKLAGLGSTVKMDGTTLKNVRSVKVSVGCDEITAVTLEIVGTAKVHGIGQIWIVDADKIAAEEAAADAASDSGCVLDDDVAALDAEEAEFEAAKQIPQAKDAEKWP